MNHQGGGQGPPPPQGHPGGSGSSPGHHQMRPGQGGQHHVPPPGHHQYAPPHPGQRHPHHGPPHHGMPPQSHGGMPPHLQQQSSQGQPGPQGQGRGMHPHGGHPQGYAGPPPHQYPPHQGHPGHYPGGPSPSHMDRPHPHGQPPAPYRQPSNSAMGHAGGPPPRGPPPPPHGNPQVMQRPGQPHGWQDPQRDYDSRRHMIAQIVRLLQQRKPDAPREWLQKLPDMARRLEDKLYRYASTKEEYMNRNSLKQRLQYIALKMAESKPKNDGSHPPGGMPGGHPPHPMHPGNQPPAPPMQQPVPKKQERNPSAGRGSQGNARPPSGKPGSMPPGQGQQPPQGYGQPPSQYPGGPGGPPPSHGAPGYNYMPGQGGGGQYPPQPPSRASSQMSAQGAPPGKDKPHASQQAQVLRQQQQRLLLLRHASRCRVPDNETCQYTPHCKQMKNLWQHIAKCKSTQCRFPHCVSSRYVLSHYHRCTDDKCQVCRPVKEAIKNMSDKSMVSGAPGMHQPPPGARGPPPPRQPGMPMGQGPPPTQGGRPPPYGHPGAMMHPNGHLPHPERQPSGGAPPNLDDPVLAQMYEQRRQAEEAAEMQKKKLQELEQQIQRLQKEKEAMAAGGAPVPPGPPGKGRGKQAKARVKKQPSSGGRGRGRGRKGDKAPPEGPGVPNGAVPPPGMGGGRGKAGKGSAPPHPHMGAMQNRMVSQQSGMGMGPPPPGGMPMHPGYKPGKPGKPGAPMPQARPNYPPHYNPAMHGPRGMPGAGGPMVPQVPRQQVHTSSSAFSGTISLINAMHRDDIKNHIASLVRFSSCVKPSELKQHLMPLLRRQLDQQFAYIFLKPVDPVEMEIPDYFDVIKHPMDLSTIKRRLDSNYYKTYKAFADDMLLVYNNAILYNPEVPNGYGVHETAKEYAQTFVEDYNKLILKLKAEENQKRINKDACKLCGGGQFTFEPPVYYCNGKCNQKIKRGASYYHTPDNKMFWCVQCYQNLRDSIEMEDGQKVEKSKLEKKKNTEVTEESWVLCNQCNRWFHQICALFNSRNEESKNSQYYCPMCILRYMDRQGIDRFPDQPSRPARFRAKDLPRTKFSDFLETRIQNRIVEERKREAKRLDINVHDIPIPGELTCRVVLSKDTEVFPRPNLERLYKVDKYKYPPSFPHKVKCILLFQDIDGVDVLFFALYTQSYGSDCPEPNSRCVYIAYLDSVYYMEPRYLRTPTYHEILIATLEYEKNRGHTKAFIWACPPLQGDDYILYCHPKEQKTQRAEMLRNWYLRLLEDARKRGVVVSVDNLYDGYIRRVCNPCGIPNFEGDYWPGVTEQFIDDLEKDKIDPTGPSPRQKRAISRNKMSGGSSKSKKSASKSKKAKGKMNKRRPKKNTTKYRASNRQGSSRSGKDDDEEEEKDNPLWPPPAPAKWVELVQQDALTAKIGEVIKQMKDDFFVVHMHHICAECSKNIDQPDELFWLPTGYSEGMGELDLVKNKYAPPYALCDTCYRTLYKEELGKEPEATPPPTLAEKKKAEEAEKSAKKEESETTTASAKRKVEKEDTSPARKRTKAEEGAQSSSSSSTSSTTPAPVVATSENTVVKVKQEPSSSADAPQVATSENKDVTESNDASVQPELSETKQEDGLNTQKAEETVEDKKESDVDKPEDASSSAKAMDTAEEQGEQVVAAKTEPEEKTEESKALTDSQDTEMQEPQGEKEEDKNKDDESAEKLETVDEKTEENKQEEETKVEQESKEKEEENKDASQDEDVKMDDPTAAEPASQETDGGIDQSQDTLASQDQDEEEKQQQAAAPEAKNGEENEKEQVGEGNDAPVPEATSSDQQENADESKQESSATMEDVEGAETKAPDSSEQVASTADSSKPESEAKETETTSGESEATKDETVAKEDTSNDDAMEVSKEDDGQAPPPPPPPTEDVENAEAEGEEQQNKRNRSKTSSGDEEMEDGEDDQNAQPLPGSRVLEQDERLLEPGVQGKPQNPWVQRPCGLDEMVLVRSYVEEKTEDPDPPMDNQFFDTRQQFLSLCQGNRYQFDQLRRAKHSSMMVLYHLHNPDEPGFVHSCNICQQEIKDDKWWKCGTCEDFDVCNRCKPTASHPHELKVAEQKKKQESSEDKNRNLSINLHMKLLEHAAGCKEAKCDNRNCAKMKMLLAHFMNPCQQRSAGHCKLCRRVWVLLQIHARQCRIPYGRCLVPRCGDIKEHLRRQQLKLADRRIRAQTDRMNQERASQPAGPTPPPGTGAEGTATPPTAYQQPPPHHMQGMQGMQGGMVGKPRRPPGK